MNRYRSTLASSSWLRIGVIATAMGLGAVTVHASAPKVPAGNVAWVPAAVDADIDSAFARAKAEKKPIFLYWGATWCPPCNQLKATLFNRQDFAERSKLFVAVHIDGDRPGAQKLGTRFKVRGYPTVILFSPDGQEITRLPGEADAQQVMAVLDAGLAGGRSVRAVLADVRAKKGLTANEWRMLGYYSWAQDEEIVRAADRPALLAQLATASPDAAVATRLWLKALSESDDGKGIRADAALRERVQRMLLDVQASRVQADTIVYGSARIVRALTAEGSPERDPLVRAYEGALRRLEADASLSRADRLSALAARVELARLDVPAEEASKPKLPPALLTDVRTVVARADREITDGYERQAVITSAADVMRRAGLLVDSDTLLKGNLTKSHSPYYLMSMLAGNAKARNDIPDALRWYEEAFNRSEGPATRLQWGSTYFVNVVDLTEKDAARIERVAAQLIKESASDPSAYYERSARSMQRVGAKLMQWNKSGQHAAVIQRLQTQLDAVCVKLPTADAQRAACESVFKAPGKPAA